MLNYGKQLFFSDLLFPVQVGLLGSSPESKNVPIARRKNRAI